MMFHLNAGMMMTFSILNISNISIIFSILT